MTLAEDLLLGIEGQSGGYALDAGFPIGENLIFEAFQRGPKPKLIQEMLDDWIEEALGTITVALGEDLPPGVASCADGGQRVRAQRARGLETLPARIITDTTYQERARIYIVMDHRVKLTPFDRYTARLEQGDVVAMNVRKAVAECGLKIVEDAHHPRGGDPTALRCAGTLLEIGERRGSDDLRRTLEIGSGWLAEERAPTGDLLRGLSRFLGENSVDDREFKRRLYSWTFAEVQAALGQHEGTPTRSGRHPAPWVTVFRDIYEARLERPDY